jgi:transcriptional regulator with XRE-family HTH domain
MSLKTWEEKVLREPGAPERVHEIEEELRLAAGLTALREEAGLSQREVARLIGVSQPRVAAIERSRNVTIDVLEQYVKALGGVLEVSVVKGTRKVSLLSGVPANKTVRPPALTRKAAAASSQARLRGERSAKKDGRRSVVAAATVAGKSTRRRSSAS